MALTVLLLSYVKQWPACLPAGIVLCGVCVSESQTETINITSTD